MNFLGALLAFVFVNDHKRLLGIRRSLLIRALPATLGLIALVTAGNLSLFLAGLVLTLLLHLFWFVVHRKGYTRFSPDNAPLPTKLKRLPNEQRIEVRATGIFSIMDREDHMFLRTAQMWRLPVGDHAIMVAIAPKRYRYEFITGNNLAKIESGHLIFGPNPLPTLAITFGSTWGPRYAQSQSAYYINPEEPPPSLRKTIYLTFADTETRGRVWQSLLAQMPAD